MSISSPFVVVPVLIVVFLACIFFGAFTKEDNPHSH